MNADDDGIHIYSKKDVLYVYLKQNVVVGEKAIHFTGFDVKKNGTILELHVTSEETEDYFNSSYHFERLYMVIRFDDDIDTIEAFNNGEHVDIISHVL